MQSSSSFVLTSEDIFICNQYFLTFIIIFDIFFVLIFSCISNLSSLSYLKYQLFKLLSSGLQDGIFSQFMSSEMYFTAKQTPALRVQLNGRLFFIQSHTRGSLGLWYLGPWTTPQGPTAPKIPTGAQVYRVTHPSALTSASFLAPDFIFFLVSVTPTFSWWTHFRSLKLQV